MKLAFHHETHYRYDTAASYAIQSLRLTPSVFPGQRVVNWKVSVSEGGPVSEFRDGFGNLVSLVTVDHPHTELTIIAAGDVETEDRHGVVADAADRAPAAVFLRSTPTTLADAAIQQLAGEIEGGDPIDRLHRLSELIRDRIDYEVGTSDSKTTAAAALSAGRGVCQDHAHVFIAASRWLGIPARYVTGYLVDGAADGDIQAEAHHAWAEAHVDGFGWLGFDVANRNCPTDHYVRLACGLDAAGAAPIRGIRRGGETETLRVRVAVGAGNVGGGQQ